MSKIKESARGEECELAIYPYCTCDTSKVVLCHIDCEDKGVGFKGPDWWAVYGCNVCHDIIDGRMETDISKNEIKLLIMRALYRTQKKIIKKGLIQVTYEKRRKA